jgi:hypothetical protein
MTALWTNPGRRRSEGEAALARARERFGEGRYLRALTELYERAVQSRVA